MPPTTRLENAVYVIRFDIHRSGVVPGHEHELTRGAVAARTDRSPFQPRPRAFGQLKLERVRAPHAGNFRGSTIFTRPVNQYQDIARNTARPYASGFTVAPAVSGTWHRSPFAAPRKCRLLPLLCVRQVGI